MQSTTRVKSLLMKANFASTTFLIMLNTLKVYASRARRENQKTNDSSALFDLRQWICWSVLNNRNVLWMVLIDLSPRFHFICLSTQCDIRWHGQKHFSLATRGHENAPWIKTNAFYQLTVSFASLILLIIVWSSPHKLFLTKNFSFLSWFSVDSFGKINPLMRSH